MIELDHLTVSVGSFSVRDFSLAIPGGSCTFLMGPSGAGKTLVLETVAGIQAPKSGRVLIDGTDVTDLPPEHRRIGFVYQDYSLFPHYTVARNIGFGMRMRGKSHHDEERVTHDLLEELGIPHLAGRSPQTLSGGEQQRVALARALAIDPVVLLLDEPFAALDPRAREECIQALERVRRDRQVTILQVSHSRDEAYRLAGEVALIDQGTLLQSGPVERVFSRPRGRKAAAIAGYENILDAQVTGRADHILDLDLGGAMVRAPGDAPVGSTVCIGIRAGALQIIRGDLPPGPGANMIPGLINSLVCTDYVCHAAIRGAADLSVVMPRAQAEGSGFRVGESVLVSFDCRDVLVLEQEGTAS